MYSEPRNPHDFEFSTLVPPDRLERSHSYCRSLPLSRDLTQPRERLEGASLCGMLVRNHPLLDHARPVLDHMQKYLPDWRETLVLTDAQGIVVALFSGALMLDRLRDELSLQVGTSLCEHSSGTNAFCLALRYHEPMSVYGNQHYCRLFRGWASIAAPVMALDGRPRAGVGLLLPALVDAGHGLALVYALAQALQSSLNMKPALSSVQDILHPQGRGRAGLTERQQQVLRLFAHGMSYKGIAQELGLRSAKTVGEHLDAIRAKLGAETRRECIRMALDRSLL